MMGHICKNYYIKYIAECFDYMQYQSQNYENIHLKQNFAVVL